MKKILSLLLAFSLALSLAACGGSASSAASSTVVSEAVSSAAASEKETAAPLSATEPLRIAGLKGPTTMGLVNLLSMEQAGTAAMDYDLQLYGAADEIAPLLIKGELDMAAIPANLAATLYQKTSGGIQAVAVNTLGVLYVVEQGDTVHSMADLKGRTILSTGKGTTPEYVLRYLLTANGLDPDKDVDIQYYSEATEVTAQMATTQDAIAVLPQPYVTAAGLKDDTLRVALDLTAEWDKVADTQLITGVTVVRKAYAEEHPDVVAAFLADYAQSVNAANTDLDGTAALCEEQGVVAKAAIAKKALPNCNIVCLTGEELKADVSGYLQVLYDADPAAVGGTLPGEDFYWTSRLIAAMADASYNKSLFHLERYEEAVLSEARALVNQYDAKLAAEPDAASRAALREEANTAIAAMLQEKAADTLDKVLFELSSQMKNAYSRSDA